MRTTGLALLTTLALVSACGSSDDGGGGGTSSGGTSSGGTSSGGTSSGGTSSGGTSSGGTSSGGSAGNAGSAGSAGNAGTGGAGTGGSPSDGGVTMSLPYGFGTCPATKPALGSSCTDQAHCCWGFDSEKPQTCNGNNWVTNNNGQCCPTAEPTLGADCDTLGSLGACCYGGNGYVCSTQTQPKKWVAGTCP